MLNTPARWIGILTLIVASLAACAAVVPPRTASIKQIQDDPRSYVDRTVKVAGEVTQVFSVVVLKYFTVNDGTGSMHVVTNQVLPRKGQRIEVTGKVAELFALGSDAMLVILEDKAGSPSGETTAYSSPP